MQEHLPILVGGQGEKRTLRLAARYGDACNFLGQAGDVAAKLAVLHRHCHEVGRDPQEIEVTHLATVLCTADEATLSAAIDTLRPARVSAQRFASTMNAGTVEDHIGRFRELAEAGVEHAIVALADLDGPDAVRRFAPVIQAFQAELPGAELPATKLPATRLPATRLPTTKG